MGTLAPSRKKKNGAANQDGSHFVTDLAGKSNLDASELMYSVLGRQVRNGSYPLHMAVRAGAPSNVVERILREGTSDLVLLVNKHGETVLHVALSEPSNIELVDLLLNDTSNRLEMSGIKDKQNGNLPIHTAAINGCSVEVTKELILLQPNSIHERNKQSKTPLDLAIEHRNCSEQVIRLLEISDHSESSL
jgi:ankyrin repeat protein